tara:strand:- start:3 stop:677 length:675 start_codon:yes stop_codon:yes gene_type:complete
MWQIQPAHITLRQIKILCKNRGVHIYMNNKLKFEFIYTLFTSGIVYLITYVTTTSAYTDTGATISLFIGLGIYLAIRKIYKKEEDFDKLSAKAYRLIIWIVPLLLITVHLTLFYINPSDELHFKEFYLLNDILWGGVFALALWPLLNLVALLENLLILFWMLIYHLGTPVFIGLVIFIFIAFVVTYTKLFALKKEAVINFSLSLATIAVLTPIIGFTVCIYLWF